MPVRGCCRAMWKRRLAEYLMAEARYAAASRLFYDAGLTRKNRRETCATR